MRIGESRLSSRASTAVAAGLSLPRQRGAGCRFGAALSPSASLRGGTWARAGSLRVPSIAAAPADAAIRMPSRTGPTERLLGARQTRGLLRVRRIVVAAGAKQDAGELVALGQQLLKSSRKLSITDRQGTVSVAVRLFCAD
jgi:hypothetical protein